MARDVLLLGSLPLRPAEAAFDAVAKHLGTLAPRIPDGEQIGWSSAARRTFHQHPMLEVDRHVPLNAGGKDPVEIFRLKPGFTAKDLKLGPYGYIENAKRSYAAFKGLRDAGIIPAGTRYQATLPGPGTSAFCIELPAEQLLPLAREALAEEIKGIVAAIPAQDLTIQLDIGMEAEHEEYLRRPEAWDQPLHEVFHWTLDQMADSVAWLANQVPAAVELGFHVCSIWHHDPAGGQDNRVLVDAANAVLSRIKRPVGYVHMPLIPEHRQEDYAPLKDLALPQGTHLYLGLLNLADGVEGAKRRIAMAEKVVTGFGIASFCGLGRPPLLNAQGPIMHSHPPIPELKRATPDTIGAVLELHKAVALS